jgi:hypothetical protein
VVLVDDSTPAYLGGLAQLTRGMSEAADGLEHAFRAGGGVSIEHYGEHFWGGLERMTGTSFDHALVRDWIPQIEGLALAWSALGLLTSWLTVNAVG